MEEIKNKEELQRLVLKEQAINGTVEARIPKNFEEGILVINGKEYKIYLEKLQDEIFYEEDNKWYVKR